MVSLFTNSRLRFEFVNRGYYMAARRYEFYLRVLKVSLTSERSERVRDMRDMRVMKNKS